MSKNRRKLLFNRQKKWNREKVDVNSVISSNNVQLKVCTFEMKLIQVKNQFYRFSSDHLKSRKVTRYFR